MEPINKEEINSAQDPLGASNPAYTLSRMTKLVRINGRNNYTQLVMCALEGYRCNRLCQYYPERVQNKRTAAVCARSKGCGYDGSFWNLLQPVNDMIKACYYWSIQTMPKPQCTLNDGTMAFMRNLRVETLQSGIAAYLVDVYNYNTEAIMGQALILNYNADSDNYNKILSAENTWFSYPLESYYYRVRIYKTVLPAQWWLCMQGVPMSVLIA